MTAFLSHLRDFNMQWTAITAASFLIWSFSYVRPRFGITASALLSFSGLSAIWVWICSENRYHTIEPYTQMGLKYVAADSFGKMLLLLLPMMALSKNKLGMRMMGELACYFFVFLNSLWIGVSVLKGCYGLDNSCGGVIGNPSIGVSLMVCTLPIFIHSWRKQWKVLLMAAFSAVASKSSVAMGLFAAYGCLWLFPWGALKEVREGAHVWMLRSLAFAAGAMGLAKIALGGQFTHDSNRFKIWAFMMDRWAAPWNIPLGTGLGTYYVFSINLQSYAALSYPGLGINTNYWWNSMHNEPLEFLFVGGALGFLLFLGTYFVALARSIQLDARIAIGVVLYGLYMTLDPALHHPIPALFGAWLFVYALRIDQDTQSLIGD